MNAQIVSASTAKPRRSTRDLVQIRDNLRKEINAKVEASTETLSLRIKELSAEIKKAKEVHAEELKVEYDKLSAEMKEMVSAAARTQNDQEAAEFGFYPHGEQHSGDKWAKVKHQRASAKELIKDLSAENDPDFRRRRTAYTTNEIEGGTICAGINQKRKDLAGPIASFDTQKKGVLCFLSVPSDAAYDPRVPRGERRRLQRFDLLFRVGSQNSINPKTGKPGKPTPIWVKLQDVIAHRPIPRDALITEAVIKFERIGTRERWFLILSLEVAEGEAPIIPKTLDPIVIEQGTMLTRPLDKDGVPYEALQYAIAWAPQGASSLGFSLEPRAKTRRIVTFGAERARKIARGADPVAPLQERTVRVGRDAQGQRFKYRAEVTRDKDGKAIIGVETAAGPASNIPQYMEDLTSIRIGNRRTETTKNHFHNWHTRFLEFVRAGVNLPVCVQHALAEENLLKWEAPRRFQRLYLQWAKDGDGDQAELHAMYEWSFQDLHLYEWQRAAETRLINRKIDTMRKEVLNLCRTYAVIYYDDRELKRSKAANKDLASTLNKWESLASFGIFRKILLTTAQRVGTKVVPVNLTNQSAVDVLLAHKKDGVS